MNKEEGFKAETNPLDGRWLIEASAGTGKTFSIAILVLRFIIEKKIKIQEILISTFTKAATSELKSRIRSFLIQAVSILKKESSEDVETMIKNIIDRIPGEEQANALQRLERAILDIDDAAIYTIHGFCQRILDEFAFESNSTFDIELISDQEDIIREIAADYWRQCIGDPENEFSQYGSVEALIEILNSIQIKSPDNLVSIAKTAVNKPLIELRTPTNFKKLQEMSGELLEIWEKDYSTIKNLLISCDDLGNKNRDQFSEEAFDETYKETVSQFLTYPSLYVMSDFKKKKDPFYLLSEDHLTSRLKKKAVDNDTPPPQHDFFKKCGMLPKLKEGTDYPVLSEFVRFFKKEILKRKRDQGVQHYSDLIRKVYEIIKKNPNGQLVAVLRNHFRAALIDEFQDTDKMQYTIFHTVFHHSETPFYMIGDPKQSIYEFRGANIFSYRDAKEDTPETHRISMPINWRSESKLIEAFNEMFDKKKNPFVYQKFIGYEKVKACEKADQQKLVIEDKTTFSTKPLEIRFVNEILDEQNRSIKRSKTNLTPVFFKNCADSIVKLIQLGREKKAYFGDKHNSVLSGDIAVLVNSNKNAVTIRDMLQKRGVPAVISFSESVFESHEADVLRIILEAIAKPNSDTAVRAALTTIFYDWPGDEIVALDTDTKKAEEIFSEFESLSSVWQKKGFMQCFSSLLMDEKKRQRILASENGERAMTNYLHLAEIIHNKQNAANLSPSDMIKLMDQERQQPSKDSEEYEQRIETDEQAVKIMTIHKSKGLEFPIVFCPDPWRAFTLKEPCLTYHQDKVQRMLLTKDIPDDILELAADESLAESCRHFYVALTRAKNKCITYWGAVKKNSKIYTFNTLFNTSTTAAYKFLENAPETFDSSSYIHCEILSDEKKDDLILDPIPTETSLDKKTIREFHTDTNEGEQLSSYSSITSAVPHLHPDDKDRDTGQETEDTDTDGTEETNVKLYTDLPRSNLSGLMLHDLFELSDYTQDADQSIVMQCVDKWFSGSDKKDSISRDATSIYDVTRHKVLREAQASLSSVTLQKRINEFEFYLGFGEIWGSAIQSRIQEIRTKEFGSLLESMDKVSQVQKTKIASCLHGYVDLIFEANGHYFVLDWKSNTLKSYDHKALSKSILESGYDIQYLLYSLAVHRHLRDTLPDYSYEKHFGGVYYIYLRGVNHATDDGIFFTKPEMEDIEKLDKLFDHKTLFNGYAHNEELKFI